MSRYPRCERCPDEHTDKCGSCIPVDPANIEVEEAIEYFEEENQIFENMLGDRAKITIEYRMNIKAIDALQRMKS